MEDAMENGLIFYSRVEWANQVAAELISLGGLQANTFK